MKVRLFVKYKKTVTRKETNKEEKIPAKTTGDQPFESEKEEKMIAIKKSHSHSTKDVIMSLLQKKYFTFCCFVQVLALRVSVRRQRLCEMEVCNFP